MSITIAQKSQTKGNVEKFFDFSNKVVFAWKYQEIFIYLYFTN